jgi:hypothetical protein
MVEGWHHVNHARQHHGFNGAYVGLAVTSHNATTSAKGVFDDVIIQQ